MIAALANPAMPGSAALLQLALPAMKRIYLSLGIIYHNIHPSLHNNALVRFCHRENTNAEFAPPAPYPTFAALPLSVRKKHARLGEDSLTPFERTVQELEICLTQLENSAGVKGTVHESNGAEIDDLLLRGHALQVQASRQLMGLWKAVEAHVRIGQWMAGRGIYPKLKECRDERSETAATAWLVRISEWNAMGVRESASSSGDV